MSYQCKILAIDGGGIRGVIPAYILQQLEASLGKPIFQCFDIIGGTSTGGIIALGLTTPVPYLPYSASQVLNFYLADESDLFVYQSSGDGFEAKYYGTCPGNPPTGIEPWLQSKLTTTMTLAQAQQVLSQSGQPIPKQVFTTCYTINGASGINIGPYLFNWLAAKSNSGDNYCVWEAARATSAAPTYFPIAQVGIGTTNGSQATARWAVDGGVAANNPALYGLVQSQQMGLWSDLSEVLIVSLGTGLYNVGIQIEGDGNWGAVQWGAGFDSNGYPTSPLLNVLSMSNVLAPHQQLTMLLPTTSYYRLEPVIPYSESTLDGTNSQALLNTAIAYIAPGGDGYNNFQAIVQALAS